jgi:poly-beta-1,6-N-acetyl-D-glucosamine synthase
VNPGGVDLVAVLKARMKGWRTRTFVEMTCRHHRSMGTAKRAWPVAVFGGGRGDYVLGSHPLWEFSRCLYQMTRRPVLAGGLLRLAGFGWAMLIRVPKAVPDDVVAFRRKEQMERLRTFILRGPRVGDR